MKRTMQINRNPEENAKISPISSMRSVNPKIPLVKYNPKSHQKFFPLVFIANLANAMAIIRRIIKTEN